MEAAETLDFCLLGNDDTRNYIFVLSGKSSIRDLMLVCSSWRRAFSSDRAIWADIVKYNFHADVFKHKPKDISYYQQFKGLLTSADQDFKTDLNNKVLKYIELESSMRDYMHRVDIVLHKYYSNPSKISDILIQSCKYDCVDIIQYFDHIDYGGATTKHDLRYQMKYNYYSFHPCVICAVIHNSTNVLRLLYKIFTSDDNSKSVVRIEEPLDRMDENSEESDIVEHTKFLPDLHYDVFGESFAYLCSAVTPDMYDLLIKLGVNDDGSHLEYFAATANNVELLDHLFKKNKFDPRDLDLYPICGTKSIKTLEWLEKFNIRPDIDQIEEGLYDDNPEYDAWVIRKGYMTKDDVQKIYRRNRR